MENYKYRSPSQRTKDIMDDFKEAVLPRKKEFFEEEKIKTQERLEKFNQKSELTAGLYIHFQQVGESSLWTWNKISIAGKEGPVIVQRNHPIFRVSKFELFFWKLKKYLKKREVIQLKLGLEF